MSVVDLHPEELLDKHARGELSAAERGRLEAHLAVCPTCCLELELRRDFELEAARLPVPQLPGRVLAGSVSNPSRCPPARRSRFAVWGLAAAGLVAATAAVASGLTWVRSELQRDETAGTMNQKFAVPISRAAKHSSTARPRPAVEPVVTDAEQERVSSAPPPSKPETREPVSRTEANAASNGHAESPASLFAAANLARRQGKVGTAMARYRALRRQFPSSEEALLSLVIGAKLDLYRGNAAVALGSFERYARAGGPLEAEALVGRATALEHLGRRNEAAAAWRVVADRCPGSTYARQATERLSALSVP
ncbi:MAG: zf-HC2 domain-containing protein [Polyangiaceae bacterium]|nr:zf-HC2 domain-containing protein [Polyangiaceae bacterium]